MARQYKTVIRHIMTALDKPPRDIMSDPDKLQRDIMRDYEKSHGA